MGWLSVTNRDDGELILRVCRPSSEGRRIQLMNALLGMDVNMARRCDLLACTSSTELEI